MRSSQIIIRHNMRNMLGAQFSMAATLWDRLGVASLSEMTCQVFLECHVANAVFDDEMRITCRLAGWYAGQGRYNTAFRMLERFVGTNEMRSWKPNQYWRKYRALVKIRRDLHRGHLDAAEVLLSELRQSRPDDLDPDIAFLVDMLHLEALVRRGDLSTAFSQIEASLAELGHGHKDIALRIRLLLHKAALFDSAGRPQKGFSIAMRAASMAWRARVMPLLWQAIGAVANVLASLGEFEASESLLLAVLPRSLECDAALLSGTLYSLLADAYMGRAGQMVGGRWAHKRTEFLLRARGALDAAFAHFSAVEDVDKKCEILAKKAAIMRAVGNNTLALSQAIQYNSIRMRAQA